MSRRRGGGESVVLAVQVQREHSICSREMFVGLVGSEWSTRTQLLRIVSPRVHFCGRVRSGDSRSAVDFCGGDERSANGEASPVVCDDRVALDDELGVHVRLFCDNHVLSRLELRSGNVVGAALVS